MMMSWDISEIDIDKNTFIVLSKLKKEKEFIFLSIQTKWPIVKITKQMAKMITFDDDGLNSQHVDWRDDGVV